MNKQKKNKVLRVASLALVLTLITTCLLANTLAKYTKTLSGYDSARVAKFEFAAEIDTFSAGGSIGGSTDLTAAGTSINLFTTSHGSDVGTTVDSDGGDKLVAPGIYGGFELVVTGESEVATRLTLTIKETNDSNTDTTIPLFYSYDGKYYANAAAKALYTEAKLTAGDIYINISNNDGSPNYTQIAVGDYGGDLTALATAVAANAATTLTGSSSTSTTVIPPNTDLSTFYVIVDWYWPFEVVEVGDATSTDYDVKEGTNYYRLLSDTNDTALGVAADNWIKLDIGATLTQVD